MAKRGLSDAEKKADEQFYRDFFGIDLNSFSAELEALLDVYGFKDEIDALNIGELSDFDIDDLSEFDIEV